MRSTNLAVFRQKTSPSYCTSMFSSATSPLNLVPSEIESMDAPDSDNASSSFVELMNYEEHDDWSIIPSSYNLDDQNFPSFSMSSPHKNLSPVNGSHSMKDCMSRSNKVNFDNVSFDGGTMLQEMDMEFPFPTDSVDGIVDLTGKKYKCPKTHNAMTSMVKNVIPKLFKPSLDEKMLKALHLYTEWFGGGTLTQVWIPTRTGDGYVLSTSGHPFLHDDTLSGYRAVSRSFTFSAEPGKESLLGLPGRVFTSKLPEWTPNVMYYKEAEYLRVQHAIDHGVRGSIALPVFEDMYERSCCAVLELVTTEEKPNFDMEMENIYHALQAVDLSSSRPSSLSPKSLSSNQNAALAEIKDILHATCQAHQLPLALAWIPCGYTKNIGHDETRSIMPNEVPILCLEETTCYVNDTNMEGFVHACADHFLEVGKGLVGKALESNEPFFYPDVKEFHVSEYPLVHHARRLGLSAAVAIRLTSAHTGEDDYILEFFLPVNLKRAAEQLHLVSNLLETMDRICRSLSKVSDTELLEEKKSDIRLLHCKVNDFSTVEHSVINDKLNSCERAPKKLHRTTEKTDNDPHKQTRQMDKGNTSEKYISLNVLQQYFSGSLKDAANSLGVCPTTLKRICRHHGISRWPFRKIKKVDRSLKRIQTVLESVPGIKGGFKFDPTKGGLEAAFSKTQDLATCEVIDVKMEEHSFGCSLRGIESCDESRLAALDTSPSWPASLSTMPWMTPSTPPSNSFLSKVGISGWDQFYGKSSMVGSDGVTGCSKEASSVMTDSGSATTMTRSSSGSLDEKAPATEEARSKYDGATITVKATYGENTVRFKFGATAGCSELYAQVAMRFKLQTEEFQLKYLDDDEEWVSLVTDSDLFECLEVLELLHTHTVKFLVDVRMRRSGTKSSSYLYSELSSSCLKDRPSGLASSDDLCDFVDYEETSLF